jgi:hypothetical protein
MKIVKLKKDKRYDSRNDKMLGIQTFGENNDYPQQVMEIIGASGTASSCINVFSKFISGQGFNNPDFFSLIINRQRQTTDELLGLIAHDFAVFNGFAIHINYSANYKITQLQYIPFETIRLGALKKNGQSDTIVLHWDWGRRMTQLKKWSKDDTITINTFNPDPQTIDTQVSEAGGWSKYKGQVLFYSGNRANNYPLPKYDAVLTDMSTEEGIANISYRNARHNFIVSGMFVDIIDWEKPENQKQIEENEENIKESQGDEDALKIWYTCAESRDRLPEFIPFSGKNYDKEYTVTREKVKDDIGRAFNQPPILRAENVGNNFGSDAIRNAYDYYNSVTAVERMQIERVFSQIFKHWNGAQFNDFSILPLAYSPTVTGEKIPVEILNTLTVNEKRSLIGYEQLQDSENDRSLLAEKIGVGGVQAMVQIVSDPNISDQQKKGMLKLLFSLTDEEVDSIIPLQK